MMMNVPLWWEVLTVGVATHVGGKGYMGNLLSLNFAVNLKLLFQNKSFI